MEPSSRKRISTVEKPSTSRQARRPPTPTKGAAPPAPKPKLTMEKQLKVIDALYSGNYVKGGGLAQFYETTPSVAKNLDVAFRGADDTAATEGAAAAANLGDPLFSSTQLAPAADETFEDRSPCFRMYMNEDPEDYANFPAYIKNMDRLIVLQDNFFRQFMNVADLKSRANFHKKLPQNTLVNLMSQMDRIAAIIDKFLKKPVVERLQLFALKPQDAKGDKKKGEKPAKIFCDVQEQEKFILGFYKIKGMLAAMQDYSLTHDDTSDLSVRLKKMTDLISKTEVGLEKLNLLEVECNDIADKAEYIERGPGSSCTPTTSSSSSSPL